MGVQNPGGDILSPDGGANIKKLMVMKADKIDIEKRTVTSPTTLGGIETCQADMYYNKSFNLIICILKDGNRTKLAIDASYFVC